MNSNRTSRRRWMACTAIAVALLGGWQAAYAQQTVQACCFPTGGCQDMLPGQCQQAGGIPGGAGTQCSDNICVERPCCLPTGGCAYYSPQYCQSIGGVPQPLGTTCENVVCHSAEECAPTPDGLRCSNVQCQNPDERCQPKCATFTQNGQLVKVESCECVFPDECHLVQQTGSTFPGCEGTCPPGTTCNRRVITNADGTLTICCECVPNEPQPCRPNSAKTACEQVTCPDPNKKCVPSKLHVNPNGVVTVEACDCRPENQCHPEYTAAAGPYCVGACPVAPAQCTEFQVITIGGGFDFYCRCQPCDPALCDDGDPCTKDYCDPYTGGCVNTPIVCDDGDPCTTDACVNGQCVFTPVNCDDGNPCTIDACVNGQCVHTPNPECEACCRQGAAGPYCTYELPTLCQASGGTPQGPGTNCTNVTCPPPQVPKFSQPVTENREDLASNINFNAPTLVNKIVSDDFRSDGRPITSVRWWGSYLNPAYIPRPFNPTEPLPMEGWLISFHRPLGPKPLTPQPALGIYFAPLEAVKIALSTVPACDQHAVFEYTVDLSKCCLVDSNPDIRVPATDPYRCPAWPDAFHERWCYRYSLGIQAVVGMKWNRATGANCCVRQQTNSFADKDFWGWHTTAVERNVRAALQSRMSVGTPSSNQCPLGECPPVQTEFWYGAWTPALPVCQPIHRINMAFELWTNVLQTPPPCHFVIVSASSVKQHGAVGEFGIDVPLGAILNAAIEPRARGVSMLKVTFDQDVMADDGALDPGEEVTTNVGTISSLSIAGPVLTIELQNVPDNSCLNVAINNGPDGITTLGSDVLEGDNDLHVRVRPGDVNGNAVVNAADIGLVKARSGMPVGPAIFVCDLNANGAINAADIGLVKSLSGSGPAVCP